MKILILKPSSLGDIVQALPVLRLLKQHLPSSQIYWWVDARLAPIASRSRWWIVSWVSRHCTYGGEPGSTPKDRQWLSSFVDCSSAVVMQPLSGMIITKIPKTRICAPFL